MLNLPKRTVMKILWFLLILALMLLIFVPLLKEPELKLTVTGISVFSSGFFRNGILIKARRRGFTELTGTIIWIIVIVSIALALFAALGLPKDISMALGNIKSQIFG